MVGSTSSLRSFSLSLAADHAAGPGRILKGATAASVLVPFPRRIAWTSRAVRNLNCALARPGLMPVHPRDGNNNNSNNNETDSLSSGRPASDSSPAAPAGAAHPTAATTSSVPVLAITFGAVGGIVALAVVLALVYVRRIRRRVKSMKRRTNVLGPELAPQLPTTPINDGTLISTPRMTQSEMTSHFLIPPPSAVSVSSTTCTELPGIIPLSPICTSTFVLSPPPAVARRSTVRSSYPVPHSNPRSPIYSSRASVPWPLTTAPPPSDRPQHDYKIRRTSSGTSGSTDA